MSKFKEKVVQIVNAIPYGKVVSYGQVAVMAGVPRAAIQVGSVLNKLEAEVEVPWWRVINNSGRITIKGSIFTPQDQQDKLEEEGIEFVEQFKCEIENYRWRPDEKKLKEFKLEDEYIFKTLSKYNLT